MPRKNFASFEECLYLHLLFYLFLNLNFRKENLFKRQPASTKRGWQPVSTILRCRLRILFTPWLGLTDPDPGPRSPEPALTPYPPRGKFCPACGWGPWWRRSWRGRGTVFWGHLRGRPQRQLKKRIYIYWDIYIYWGFQAISF